jgi:hypothetical protein
LELPITDKCSYYFNLMPRQEINDKSVFFTTVCKAIKASDIDYEITEDGHVVESRVTSRRPDMCQHPQG